MGSHSSLRCCHLLCDTESHLPSCTLYPSNPGHHLLIFTSAVSEPAHPPDPASIPYGPRETPAPGLTQFPASSLHPSRESSWRRHALRATALAPGVCERLALGSGTDPPLAIVLSAASRGCAAQSSTRPCGAIPIPSAEASTPFPFLVCVYRRAWRPEVNTGAVPLLKLQFLTGIWGLMVRLAGQRAPGVQPSMHYCTRLFTWVLGSELRCLDSYGKCFPSPVSEREG